MWASGTPDEAQSLRKEDSQDQSKLMSETGRLRRATRPGFRRPRATRSLTRGVIPAPDGAADWAAANFGVNQSNSCELAGSIELLLGVVPRSLGNSCANSESRSVPDNVRPEVGGWLRRAKAARNATYDTDWEVVSFGNSPPRAWQEQPNLYRINSSGLSIRERRERQYLLPCWAVTASRPVCIARCAGPRVGVMCWLNPGFPPSRRHGRVGSATPCWAAA